MRRWLIIIGLLLALWGSRIAALDRLPLHNDEGLHLQRAEKVWDGHPFWEISDGKVINHWPVALLYPQGNPVYAGRMATVLVAMIGLAAGYALVERQAGKYAAIIAAALWIASPYLFFFERLALSDAEAGALIVVAVWAAVLLIERGRRRYAVLAGLALAAAALFKLTAAPFALTVALIVLFGGSISWRQRTLALVIIGGVVVICFAVPVTYLLVTGRDFGVAFAWIDPGGQSGGGLALGDNLARLWDQLTGFGTLFWVGLLLSGLLILSIRLAAQTESQARRMGALVVVGGCVPVLIMAVFGHDVRPRHYVAGLPLVLLLAGWGWGRHIADRRRHAWPLTAFVLGMLAVGIVPFARAAYHDPGDMRLSAELRAEYITGHSAGFGLREAVLAFPKTIGAPGLPVVASMFPDSCKRANFYDTVGYDMVCPTAPGLTEIKAALAQSGTVYVLAERPPIGLRFEQTDLPASRISGYPRPGETEETASVVLWRVSNKE
jgi:hypothetical protein